MAASVASGKSHVSHVSHASLASGDMANEASKTGALQVENTFYSKRTHSIEHGK